MLDGYVFAENLDITARASRQIYETACLPGQPGSTGNLNSAVIIHHKLFFFDVPHVTFDHPAPY
jgi:hypothetical protein